MIPKPYGGCIGGNPPILDDETWQRFEDAHPMPWREPIYIANEVDDEHGTRLGCRICIARYGLLGKHVRLLPSTFAEFCEHIKEYHAVASVASVARKQGVHAPQCPTWGQSNTAKSQQKRRKAKE